MPTRFTPLVEKSSYAASIRRSRGLAATPAFFVSNFLPPVRGTPVRGVIRLSRFKSVS